MFHENKTCSRLIPVTVAVLALAVLWFYWPVLAQLFADLAENEDYSFGLLLPLVSGYIIYLKLPQLRTYLWRPSWLGLLCIAAGFALYIVGELGADLYIPRVSFVIVMTGYVDDFSYDQAIDAGASDFIKKPFTLKELMMRIKHVRMQEKLRTISITDELTGLLNRRGFFALAQ